MSTGLIRTGVVLALLLACASPLWASEADLKIPTLTPAQNNWLYAGIVVCFIGMAFGAILYNRVKNLPAHKSMLDVAGIIFETCKTYLWQQGKLLMLLEVFIGLCIIYYFGFLSHMSVGSVALILLWSVIGILGSYGVAWFGIRMNTLANARMAFAALRRQPIKLLNIPLEAGMSIGVMLICVELIVMLFILIWMPRDLAGACFIGFAIGESLGASALRICGGIFTKIADIGSDLMKVVFKIKEDDPRNPGVIADCTGDNAGDSVGPTADGFETYGVTGVALISFIVLAVTQESMQMELLTWIFVMRALMVLVSIGSYLLNNVFTTMTCGTSDTIDFEKPLNRLVMLTSFLSIAVTFAVSYLLLAKPEFGSLWIWLSVIISCGTAAGWLIPEFTQIFTSTKSKHTREVVTASKEGGASLTVLSGLVAGNFSAFWQGILIAGLMFVAYWASGMGLGAFMIYPSIFAFGLVAFGFLGMGPVTIAVDSYGPVTDNAQSIYELSLIETLPNISQEIEKDFGFKPDFEKAKQYLEENDGAGNTFKATAKPVLIGTAVVGATTMIFSLILVLKKVLGIEPEMVLNLLNPYTLLGFLCGGAVVYWFTGASIQAVTTGAYRAVEYIKKNIKLDENAAKSASVEASKEVVKICTQYAQAGMFNIFIAIFCFALAFAFLSAPGKVAHETAAPVAPAGAPAVVPATPAAPVVPAPVQGGGAAPTVAPAPAAAPAAPAVTSTPVPAAAELAAPVAPAPAAMPAGCVMPPAGAPCPVMAAPAADALAAAKKALEEHSAPASFFISYLIAIAVFGLFQAIFMANAGGCWDNAKKLVECELKAKGTPLHDATVIGDTVGDPFKDTSSVALNPIIKFTTLFGLLAMEIALELSRSTALTFGMVFFAVALIFVWRSFYAMRIPVDEQ